MAILMKALIHRIEEKSDLLTRGFLKRFDNEDRKKGRDENKAKKEEVEDVACNVCC